MDPGTIALILIGGYLAWRAFKWLVLDSDYADRIGKGR